LGRGDAPQFELCTNATARGLITYYVLFVIDLKCRRIEIAGITPTPDRAFIEQVARYPTADSIALKCRRNSEKRLPQEFSDFDQGVQRRFS
jgi:hypothetical protein